MAFSTLPSNPLKSNGVRPTTASPRHAMARLTISTEMRPSSAQYTSCRWRMSANSSSTNEVPTPTRMAATIVHAESDPVVPTATNAPITRRMMPGTAWWMCSSAAGHVVVERALAGADHAGDRASGQERDDECGEAHQQRHVDVATAEVELELQLHRSTLRGDLDIPRVVLVKRRSVGGGPRRCVRRRGCGVGGSRGGCRRVGCRARVALGGGCRRRLGAGRRTCVLRGWW